MKKKMAIFSFSIIICGVIVLFFKKPSADVPQQNTKAKPHTIDSLNPQNNRTENSIKDHKDTVKYLKELKNVNLQMKKQTPVEIETEKWQPSDEELAKMDEISKTISPYLRKEAPVVYEEMISEQNRDEVWTGAIKEEVNKLLSKAEYQGTSLVQVECFTTLCKGEFEHDSEDSFDLFMSHAIGAEINVPSHNFFTENQNGDGAVSSQIYFARNGDDELLFTEMRKRLYKKVRNM